MQFRRHFMKSPLIHSFVLFYSSIFFFTNQKPYNWIYFSVGDDNRQESAFDILSVDR